MPEIEKIRTHVHPTLNTPKITLYPNPATESFQIIGIEGTASIVISDLHCIVQIKTQITGDESISVKTLRNGVYIAKITSSTGVVERKLTKA